MIVSRKKLKYFIIICVLFFILFLQILSKHFFIKKPILLFVALIFFSFNFTTSVKLKLYHFLIFKHKALCNTNHIFITILIF